MTFTGLLHHQTFFSELFLPLNGKLWRQAWMTPSAAGATVPIFISFAQHCCLASFHHSLWSQLYIFLDAFYQMENVFLYAVNVVTCTCWFSHAKPVLQSWMLPVIKIPEWSWCIAIFIDFWTQLVNILKNLCLCSWGILVYSVLLLECFSWHGIRAVRPTNKASFSF